MGREFEIDELVRVAKRENNNKRAYLYVDPLQGKHMPVSPGQSLELFAELAKKAEEKYKDESLLIVGFAETATAIGSAAAYYGKNAAYYMNTTREDIPGAEYFFFTESHSHATEQRLVVNGLEQVLSKADRIVFAEDEVTTGNTIEKLIFRLKARYPDRKLAFGILSILNSMEEERLSQLESQGISCTFVRRIPQQYRIGEIERYQYEPLKTEPAIWEGAPAPCLPIGNRWDSRIVCDTDTLRKKSRAFAAEALEKLPILSNTGKILILGTEEFMFPGMLLGQALEKKYPGMTVRSHATTRSPIEVSLDSRYPLHSREPLESLYEKGRRTFIYDLDRYDQVIVATDAQNINEEGKRSLTGALRACGNTHITFVEWRDQP